MKLFPLALAATLASAGLHAQMRDNTTPELRCNNSENDDSRARYCEMREQTTAYGGQLNIDTGANGGVAVKGWSRPDMLVRMKIDTQAANDADARALASQVRVNIGAGRVAAEGPQRGDGQNWSVSYEIFLPHSANLQISTHNGGVHIADVRGDIAFTTTNGGVHLARLGGNVHGQTSNGGVHIELAGSRWDGAGLDVTTTNGGVHIAAPANYGAHFEAETSNGRISVDFPMNVQGKIGHQLAADVGGGGPRLHVATTNGGVHMERVSE